MSLTTPPKYHYRIRFFNEDTGWEWYETACHPINYNLEEVYYIHQARLENKKSLTESLYGIVSVDRAVDTYDATST